MMMEVNGCTKSSKGLTGVITEGDLISSVMEMCRLITQDETHMQYPSNYIVLSMRTDRGKLGN